MSSSPDEEVLNASVDSEDETSADERFTNWGSIISTVKENLPGLDSDSELSTVTEDSDNEPNVFTRKVASTDPALVTSELSGPSKQVKSDEVVSSVLFQRLQCQSLAASNKDQDLHVEDLEFPIYEDDDVNTDKPFSCLDENGNPIITEKPSLLLSNDTDVAMKRLVSSPLSNAPTLSSKVLETLSLDEALENVDENVDFNEVYQDYQSKTQDQSSCKELMGELVGLSLLQSGPEKKNTEETSKKTSTTSRGVTASFPLDRGRERARRPSKAHHPPSHPELSYSEPTTIYLDLRSKFQQSFEETEEMAKAKTEPRNQPRKAAPIRNSKKLLSLQRSNETTQLSDSDQDDFEEWKNLRRKFKTSGTKTSKLMQSDQDGMPDPTAKLTSSKSPSFSNETAPASQKPSEDDSPADCFRYSTNFLDYDEIIANPEAEENKIKLRNLTLQKVKQVKDKLRNLSPIKKEETREACNGKIVTNGLDALDQQTHQGIYASQRLKTLSKDGVDAPNSFTKQKPSGKSTVLFAEEPKKNENDTMNVYRSKEMNDSTTTSMQTDQSYPLSYDARSYTNGLLCSTNELQAAAQKLVEEKKQPLPLQSEDEVPKCWVASSSRDSYSILQKQRKQPAFSKAPAAKPIVAAPAVPVEAKQKVRAALQRKFKEQFNSHEAKMFPLLYDREITFERDISTIPDRIDKEAREKMVLLTFHMSSAGCVIMNRSAGSHRFVSVDSSSGLSITYALLLSWLLALIPDNLDKPHDPPREDVFTLDVDHEPDPIADGFDDLPPTNLIEVPFNVVSLHQVWQEETQTIATNALVIPNFFYKPDTNNRRKKPKKEDAFLQVVWHFLQSNRIQEVCPWHNRPESPILYNPHEMLLTCATKPMSTYITATNDQQCLQKALTRKPGFLWKVVKGDDSSPPSTSSSTNQMQTTVCLLQQDAFTYPVCLLDLVLRLQSSCLDVSSLRLLYVTRKFLHKNTLDYVNVEEPDEMVPCVAMAIRGKSAIKKMVSIIGSRDPVLARMTDEGSLNGVYGQQLSKQRGDKSLPKEMSVFHSPRGAERAQQLLVTWFSGRISAEDCESLSSTAGQLNTKTTKPSSKQNGKSQSNGQSANNASNVKKPTMEEPRCIGGSSFLVASSPSRVCLVVSARFPPHYLGDIIAIVAEQGFSLEGLKRTNLSDKKVAALCIPSRFSVYFKPPPNPDVVIGEEYYEIDSWWLRPVTILLLARENASAHQSGLISYIQSELMYRMIHPQEEGHLRNVTNQCFHVVPYNDNLMTVLGPMSKTPDVELNSWGFPHTFHSDPEQEQIVVFSLIGADDIADSGGILQTVFHGEFAVDDGGFPVSVSLPPNDNEAGYASDFQGFEVLGIKYIATLSTHQAKELTPYEVGTKQWYESIPYIKSSPVLMCVLRRVNAYDVLRAVLNMSAARQKCDVTHRGVTRLMSSTPEITYRQIRMFFSEQELFADNRCRPLLKFLPPPIRIAQFIHGNHGEEGSGDISLVMAKDFSKTSKRKKKDFGKRKETTSTFYPVEESILSSMLTMPRPLSSLLIIKPDAFPRHFVKILKRVHKEGFDVVAARMSVISEDQAALIMPSNYEKMPGEQRIFISHMTSGPSLVLCVQRHNAVRKLVELAGPSNPRDIRRRDRFYGRDTWRAEFGIDEFSNAIHVSERYVSACEEQKLFFPEGLCCNETIELKMEQIPTPAVDHVMCQDKMKGREIQTNCDIDDVGITGMEVQSVCVVMMSPMICGTRSRATTPHPRAPPYVNVLEQLITQGYELCALRMCWLRDEQAKCIYNLIGGRPDKKIKMVDLLTSGSCLVLLIQRENGLLLFDSIMGSCMKQHSLQHHTDHFLRTQTTHQTHQTSLYAFHRIDNRRSVFQIGHKRALEWKTNPCT